MAEEKCSRTLGQWFWWAIWRLPTIRRAMMFWFRFQFHAAIRIVGLLFDAGAPDWLVNFAGAVLGTRYAWTYCYRSGFAMR